MNTKRPAKVLQWAKETFGDVAIDPTERAMRFLEEAMELSQVMGIDLNTVAAITARVYSREPGALGKEIGQAQMTLEVLAERMGRCADTEAEIEFLRVQEIPKEHFQKRHQAKKELGIAR